MTESPTPYHTTIAPSYPTIDPEALKICRLCFHRAISQYEAAERITALMHRRVSDARAGWIAVDSGNGWIAFAQEDELP